MEKDYTEEEYRKEVSKRKRQFKKLFMEMLNYKKREYRPKDNFFQLLDKVKNCYHYYQFDLYKMQEAIKDKGQVWGEEGEFFPMKNREIVEVMDKMYQRLTSPSNGYQQHDIEFVLHENETKDDLINQELEKLSSLFREMLDFVHEQYNEDDSYYDLRTLILKHYPYFFSEVSYYPTLFNETYISALLHMESNYNYMKKRYQNHDEDLKKYQLQTDDIDEW